MTNKKGLAYRDSRPGPVEQLTQVMSHVITTQVHCQITPAVDCWFRFLFAAPRLIGPQETWNYLTAIAIHQTVFLGMLIWAACLFTGRPRLVFCVAAPAMLILALELAYVGEKHLIVGEPYRFPPLTSKLLTLTHTEGALGLHVNWTAETFGFQRASTMEHVRQVKQILLRASLGLPMASTDDTDIVEQLVAHELVRVVQSHDGKRLEITDLGDCVLQQTK